jgi:predicted 3-demethylubiquinone-9 3-methyltransferase (glyoxalase superfamily)
MQKITPMFWFDNQAEEAVNFYVSVFKNSKVKQITHYTGEEFSEKKGQVMTVSFELNGHRRVSGTTVLFEISDRFFVPSFPSGKNSAFRQLTTDH